jgi:hypothetical protein
LLFAYMGRNVRGDRARMIWVVTLFIPLVSISSYLGLLWGVTIGVIEMPAGHPLDEAVSQWGRYLTWAFSTPLILAALVVAEHRAVAEREPQHRNQDLVGQQQVQHCRQVATRRREESEPDPMARCRRPTAFLFTAVYQIT